jgi:YesN/AraC family two-component response regulator
MGTSVLKTTDPLDILRILLQDLTCEETQRLRFLTTLHNASPNESIKLKVNFTQERSDPSLNRSSFLSLRNVRFPQTVLSVSDFSKIAAEAAAIILAVVTCSTTTQNNSDEDEDEDDAITSVTAVPLTLNLLLHDKSTITKTTLENFFSEFDLDSITDKQVLEDIFLTCWKTIKNLTNNEDSKLKLKIINHIHQLFNNKMELHNTHLFVKPYQALAKLLTDREICFLDSNGVDSQVGWSKAALNWVARFPSAEYLNTQKQGLASVVTYLFKNGQFLLFN